VPRRRLTGMAALSAATLATAGLSGAGIAADECADDTCATDAVSMSDLVRAFAGDDIPEEALAKLDQIYEQIGLDPSLFMGLDPEAAFLKLGDAGADDAAMLKLGDILGAMAAEGVPEDAFNKLTQIYEQLGIDPGAAFPKLGDAEAFLKLGDIEAAFPKVEDPLAGIEEALLKLGASGEVDPAMLESILEMLPEDE
jgi:hypothetical protein